MATPEEDHRLLLTVSHEGQVRLRTCESCTSDPEEVMRMLDVVREYLRPLLEPAASRDGRGTDD